MADYQCIYSVDRLGQPNLGDQTSSYVWQKTDRLKFDFPPTQVLLCGGESRQEFPHIDIFTKNRIFLSPFRDKKRLVFWCLFTDSCTTIYSAYIIYHAFKGKYTTCCGISTIKTSELLQNGCIIMIFNF